MSLKKINLDLLHIFLPLGIIFLVLAFLFNKNSSILIQGIVTMTLIYLGFSFMHHNVDKTLTLEVALEYILIACLVLVILAGVIL